MEHVCYVSSIVTVIMTEKDAEKEVITGADWNVVSEDLAYSLDASNPSRNFHIYTASKIRAEKAGWEFMKTYKVDLMTGVGVAMIADSRISRSPISLSRRRYLRLSMALCILRWQVRLAWM